jgi:hypothetical protein
MPNNVTARLLVSGPEASLRSFIDRCLRPDDESEDAKVILDFQAVLPMPPILRATRNGCNVDLALLVIEKTPKKLAAFLADATWHRRDVRTVDELRYWLEKNSPESFDFAEASLRARKATGFDDWHAWRTKHWGTKWNSYGFRVESESPTSLECVFMTAWDFPEPVFVALGRMFPELSFSVVCFDEGWNFAGRGVFGSGGAGRLVSEAATKENYEEVFGEPPPKDED